MRCSATDKKSSSASKTHNETHAGTRSLRSIKETYNKIRPAKRERGRTVMLMLLLRVVDHALCALRVVESVRARRHHPSHAHHAPNRLHRVPLRC